LWTEEANPKSESFATPKADRSTLDGFTSPCESPWAWRYDKPRTVCASRARPSEEGRGSVLLSFAVVVVVVAVFVVEGCRSLLLLVVLVVLVVSLVVVFEVFEVVAVAVVAVAVAIVVVVVVEEEEEVGVGVLIVVVVEVVNRDASRPTDRR